MAVKIIDLKDDYIKFRTRLRALGFKGDSLNIGVKVADDMLKHFHIMQVAKFQTAKNKVARLEKNLKKRLSDPLPKKLRGKRRHFNRKYPYANSGALRDSVHLKLEKSVSEKRWVYEFTAVANGRGKSSYDHATLTNKNITKLYPQKRKVAWEHWWDEAMDRGHSSRIIGARDLMESLFKKGQE